MTTIELNKALREYAIEDMGYAKEGGQIAIAQTLKGLITLKVVDAPYEAYQVYNNRNEQLTGVMSEEQMIVWLSKVYDVSEVEVID
jgi:hypothetical protein